MPNAPRTFRLDALILKHMNFGEADRIVVAFSNERGKVRAIAKGVRKIHSRKAGHLEPFIHTRLFLAQGRDMPIITQAQTVEAFSGLRSNLVKIGYASYVIELLDRFSSEDGANHSLFRLSLETLHRLENLNDHSTVIQYFELQMLAHQGFKPELFNCVRCREKILAEDQFFSAELGGVLCPKDGVLVPGAQSVSMTALKFLRHYQRSEFIEASRVGIDHRILEEMSNLTRHYITFLLERKLNSPDFIKVIEQLNAHGA